MTYVGSDPSLSLFVADPLLSGSDPGVSFAAFRGQTPASLSPRLRAAARLLQFGHELQLPQRVVPHPFEHRADGPERLTTRLVEAVLFVGARVDESRLRECSQLQGHGAKCDVWHRPGDV